MTLVTKGAVRRDAWMCVEERLQSHGEEEAVRGRCEGGPRLKLDTGSRGRFQGGRDVCARARVPEHKPVWPV